MICMIGKLYCSLFIFIYWVELNLICCGKLIFWQYITHTRQIVEEALKSSVLGEEDAAYIESYGSSLSTSRLTDTSDGILGQMLTYVLANIW